MKRCYPSPKRRSDQRKKTDDSVAADSPGQGAGDRGGAAGFASARNAKPDDVANGTDRATLRIAGIPPQDCFRYPVQAVQKQWMHTLSASPGTPLALSRSRASTVNGVARHPRERGRPVRCSVLPRIDKEADNGLFTKRLGGLQPVQTLNEYKALPVRPY